jgi:hypothetical protein
MFSFPVTIPVRKNESIFPVFVSVAIDDIVIVKPLLDNAHPFGVESTSVDLIPLTELVFADGRKMPVLEPPHIINCYLDAYRSLEDFYTEGRAAVVEESLGDNVVPLFKAAPCVTLEGSTPD